VVKEKTKIVYFVPISRLHVPKLISPNVIDPIPLPFKPKVDKRHD
jgi:hypothetical protein